MKQPLDKAADRRNVGGDKVFRVHDLTVDGGHRTAPDSGIIARGGIFYPVNGKFRIHAFLGNDQV